MWRGQTLEAAAAGRERERALLQHQIHLYILHRAGMAVRHVLANLVRGLLGTAMSSWRWNAEGAKAAQALAEAMSTMQDRMRHGRLERWRAIDRSRSGGEPQRRHRGYDRRSRCSVGAAPLFHASMLSVNQN